jgi:hypothetical protein
MPTDRSALLRFFANVGRLGGRLGVKNENVATGLGVLFTVAVALAAISILVWIF